VTRTNWGPHRTGSRRDDAASSGVKTREHDAVDGTADAFERGLDLDRVAFFSDAVFAIAMTVLVVSLRLPADTTNAGVAAALRKELPSVYAYFLSFAVIGLYWVAHHRHFRLICRIDSTMLLLNLAALSLVAFLPFPTQVLGENTGSRAAVIFYAATVALLGALITGSWAYDCYHHRLIRPDTPDALVRHSLWRGVIVVAVFTLSIPVAFVHPHAAELFWLLIVPGRFVLHRAYGSIAGS